jgi:molecular chaperone GrpE
MQTADSRPENTEEAMTQEQFESQASSESSDSSKESSPHIEAEAATDFSGAVDAKSTPEYLEMQNKYQRLMAEFDTFRRRNARESLELMEQANAKLIGRLTDVLENYDRALSVAVPEGAEDYARGVTLIRDQFFGILKEFGLEIMDPQGESFDPNLHEALMQQPSAEIPAEHISTVYQKGYLVKGKVIRHAKVIVSTGQE